MISIKISMEPLKEQIRTSTITEVTYVQIKEVLIKFSEVFKKALTREQRKRLLQLLVHQITIADD